MFKMFSSIKPIIGFLLFSIQLLQGFFYEPPTYPMPGSQYFHRCSCRGCILGKVTPNMSHHVKQFPEDTATHPKNPADILWHEFIKGTFKALAAGPYSTRHDCNFRNCIGPSESQYFLNHYLDRIEDLRLAIEEATKKNINLDEGWYRYPTPNQILETGHKIANTKLENRRANRMLDDLRYKILDLFRNILAECPEPRSKNMAYLYNLGHLEFVEGEYEASVETLGQFVDLALENNLPKFLDAKTLGIRGSSCIEVGLFGQAIEYLSLAIQKDPKNKEFHFDRAVAYFEIGEFDRAFEDYISSASTTLKPMEDASIPFKDAFIEAYRGTFKERVREFEPHLLKTVHGIETALWAFADDPISSTTALANSCYDFSENCIEYFKDLNYEKLEDYGSELKGFYNQFIGSNSEEKAKILGTFLANYGPDVFIGSLAVKGVGAIRNIKKANRLCNLESMAVSQSNKEKVITAATKHATEREAYFKSVKLEWGKQGKHIPGKHNYDPMRSQLTHPDPEKLLKEYSGKGQPANSKSPGMPDYRERVDFNEVIGFYVDQAAPEIKLPTTKGTIRYSKRGAHIVPSHPEGK